MMSVQIDRTTAEFKANFSKLKALYENHAMQMTNILNASFRKCKCGQHEKTKQENRRLYTWIYEVTSNMDQYGCKTAQRIHWILNQLDDFPKCQICNSPIIDPKQFKTIQTGYRPFCCNACAKKSASIKSKHTRFSKNDGKYFSDESLKKQKQTFIDHYGVDHNMKCKEGLKAYADGVEKKYGEGIRNVFQAKAVIDKLEQTKFERYGDKKWNNAEQARLTYKNRPQEEKDKQQQSFRKASLEHYGVEHPMKDHSICVKAQKNRRNRCYCIDGYYFDSMAEFCFYVCCRDFGIEIQCHPILKTIMYYDKLGKMHQYFPDFFIPSINRLVEIKGSQFFKDRNESSSLIDLYGKSDIGASRSEAKYECMRANNVLIISTSRYSLYERRVKRKYGNRWIKSHKIVSK